MDNQRLFLFASMGFIMLLLWQQWQIDYGPKPVEPQSSESEDSQLATPTQNQTLNGDVPVAATPSQSTEASDNAIVAEVEAPVEGQMITVSTDVTDLRINTLGGNIYEVLLKDYPVSIEQPDEPFLLMSDSPNRFFIAQSGLQSNKSAAPTHHAIYTVTQAYFELEDGQDTLRVPMVWQDRGIHVTKTLIFTRGSHRIDVEYAIENNSGDVWTGNQYRQLQRKGITDEGGSMFGAQAYIGGVISSAENRYEKIGFDDMADEDLKRKIQGGWAAIIQHYFLAAWAPAADETNTYYTKALLDRNRYILGFYSDALSIPAGASGMFKATFYAGPKIQEDLSQVAENLNLTVDYGFLAILAEPLFWLLKWIHDNVTSNWGWAILAVTLIIKLLFYKLSEISYRSMARMRKLQPQMQALKERFGDDRQKMGQATMELYKKEKVNPLGGCLPILIQIPVFIALYWVLLESVELRQAPFILWIEDLAIRDPYYVLPLVMGVTMWIQQKLNPAPVDPIQAKIFMAMPFVFTIFFAFFPSGLVLYWVANNTLSIAQQYYITRHVLAEK
ncbi:MAG: membrane protein insertase YidC [Pseudomonadota bacterium]